MRSLQSAAARTSSHMRCQFSRSESSEFSESSDSSDSSESSESSESSVPRTEAPGNPAQALESEAVQGSAEAQFELGASYVAGLPGVRNEETSIPNTQALSFLGPYGLVGAGKFNLSFLWLIGEVRRRLCTGTLGS